MTTEQPTDPVAEQKYQWRPDGMYYIRNLCQRCGKPWDALAVSPWTTECPDCKRGPLPVTEQTGGDGDDLHTRHRTNSILNPAPSPQAAVSGTLKERIAQALYDYQETDDGDSGHIRHLIDFFDEDALADVIVKVAAAQSPEPSATGTLHQRLWDLVRHQRSELHVAELITDDEYAELAKDHGAVKRLEDYDALRLSRVPSPTRPPVETDAIELALDNLRDGLWLSLKTIKVARAQLASLLQRVAEEL